MKSVYRPLQLTYYSTPLSNTLIAEQEKNTLREKGGQSTRVQAASSGPGQVEDVGDLYVVLTRFIYSLHSWLWHFLK